MTQVDPIESEERAMDATYDAAVSSQGDVVIPEALRARLGIRSGGTIQFVVRGNGPVTLRQPNWTIDSVLGSVVPLRPMSIDCDAEIEEAMEEALAEKYRWIQRGALS